MALAGYWAKQASWCAWPEQGPGHHWLLAPGEGREWLLGGQEGRTLARPWPVPGKALARPGEGPVRPWQGPAKALAGRGDQEGRTLGPRPEKGLFFEKRVLFRGYLALPGAFWSHFS